jgi:hypothetical protein
VYIDTIRELLRMLFSETGRHAYVCLQEQEETGYADVCLYTRICMPINTFACKKQKRQRKSSSNKREKGTNESKKRHKQYETGRHAYVRLHNKRKQAHIRVYEPIYTRMCASYTPRLRSPAKQEEKKRQRKGKKKDVRDTRGRHRCCRRWSLTETARRR